MRIGRYLSTTGARVFVDNGQGPVDAGVDWIDPSPAGPALDPAALRLLCPVFRPSKVVAVGLNYRDHAEESGMPIPDLPLIFAKFPSSIVGPEASIEIPAEGAQVDFEAELGVVIGRRAADVSVAAAMEHVLGFTCVNDVSSRSVQFGDGQWVRGKSFDTFCPVGPTIVTTDEIGDPHDLAIGCAVNGEVMQQSSTSQMAFGVAELVSFISSNMTLEPGDLIATGTPPGVGMARNPPQYLAAGDRVSVEIERIGRLHNPVEGPPARERHWSIV